MPTSITDPRLRTVMAGQLITVEQIAKLCDRQRATVEGWKARDHRGRREAASLPEPILPTEGQAGYMRSPLYSLKEVLTYLHSTGRIPAGGPNFAAAGVNPNLSV